MSEADRPAQKHSGRKVIVASTAGFCFGVKRAVSMAYDQAEAGNRPIYTFGPIIHNEHVIEDLERRGVRIIENEEELAGIREGTVIIRSHGAGRAVYDQIRSQNLTLIDATCPFVQKIHRIVEERSRDGWDILIIGNAMHAEVKGICGWVHGEAHVVETPEQAMEFAQRKKEEQTCKNHRLCVVSQTTFNTKKFNKIVEIISKIGYDVEDILNTICNATQERQTEARTLAARSDVMIVIGGKNSSNTQKLYEICKLECEKTYFVQSLVDLDFRLLPSLGCVGITAGASTPNILIEEVSKQCQK